MSCGTNPLESPVMDLLQRLDLLNGLILQRYEGSREPTPQADGAFQEPDSWKETRHGRRHDSQG